ncbi:MAG: threonine/serine dehydratase [Geminicoccaceae bacterium]
MSLPVVDSADIEAAAARIAGRVRETPVIRIEAGELAPCPVFLKLESLQHAGSFKPRGAFNTLLQQVEPPRAVIAASGGNHGIAVAYAAGTLGIPAEIFVPLISSPVKVERLRRLGATVHQTGRDYAEALAAMRERQAETGALDIHAYDQPGTVAGQGTLARELEAQLDGPFEGEFEDRAAGDIQAAFFAVGGGGLIGGALAWMGDRVPVVAVEPRSSRALHAALEAGTPVDVEVSGVAADSLGARRIGDIAFALARERLHRSLLVEDACITRARKWLFEELRIVTEPGGATALAALLEGQLDLDPARPVAVIVCGGNGSVEDLTGS